jgi:flagellar basal body rod protein FlgB
LRNLVDETASQISVINSDQDGVKLDDEMTDLIQNTLRYQAVLTAMSRLGTLTRTAMEGGSR